MTEEPLAIPAFLDRGWLELSIPELVARVHAANDLRARREKRRQAARRRVLIHESERSLAAARLRAAKAATARWKAWHERERREAAARGLSVEALHERCGARRRRRPSGQR